MNDFRDLRRALVRTGDGISVILWFLIFAAILVRLVLADGFSLDKLRFVAFPGILFAIFCRFRVSDYSLELKTSLWGLVNINCFGFFLIYLEFFK